MAALLKLKCHSHLRNLGHELAGARLRRVQDCKRLIGLQQRRNRLRALIRGSKGKVRALWRTGLLPAAAHGSGTSGV
eukprot:4784417-Pyramimonas_sp.AAC.1